MSGNPVNFVDPMGLISLGCFLNGLQLGLDGLGLIPGIGIIPDLLNAGISTGRGDFGGALLSLGAAIPILGQGVTAGKLGAKAKPFFKTTGEAKTAAKALGWKRVKGVPFNSHGQPVFQKGKNYYTPDADGHKKGVWKEFNLKGKRTGTLDKDLNRIGK